MAKTVKASSVTSTEDSNETVDEQKGKIRYPFGKHHQYTMDRLQFVLYEKGSSNPTYHPDLESMLKSARESLQKKKIEQSPEDIDGFTRVETAIKEALKELLVIGKGIKLSDVKKGYEAYRDEESRLAQERADKKAGEEV